MSEPTRKKSTSSDSELSDGWSIVDHSDTSPLTVRNHERLPQLHTAMQVKTTPRVNPHEETSSDAESVEIIHEENINDFTLPHNISRITKIITGGDEKEIKSDNDCFQEKELTEPREVTVIESGSEYWINTGVYSNEWFRIFVFMSSLLAFFLLLISSTSLFFKVQAYSKSDGLIVLPDEDLSSLIADLALFKEENSRLKEELNMIKYEYGGSKKNDEPIDIISHNDISSGFEVISDSAQQNAERIHFINGQVNVPLVNVNIVDKQASVGEQVENGQVPLSSQPSNNEKPIDSEQTSSFSSGPQERRLINLLHLEQEIKKFANSIGMSDVIISSYDITNKINNINAIVNSLSSVIDQTNDKRKENKKHQLKQKLGKLKDKIEQEFKKSIEKVAKRINKFHSEFLQAYCRIKSGTSDIAGVDCNMNGQNRKNYQKNNNKINQKRNKASKSSKISDTGYSSEKVESESKPNSASDDKTISDSDENFKIRYKRNGDSMGQGSKKNGERKEYLFDEKIKHNNDKLMKEGLHRNDYNVNENADDYGKKGSPKSNIYESDWKGKRERPGLKKEFSNDEIKWDQKNKNVGGNKINSSPKYHKFENIANFDKKDNLGKPEKRIKSGKCQKKKCDNRRDNGNKQNIVYNKNGETIMKMDSSGKNPSGKIHNESIYSKIINNNAKQKTEPNGEWYLDLGEIRNQKRLRRSVRDRSSWLFDRALVREWCRSNSGSLLCASFGHSCDYCFF